jgi:hypothetical protein
MPTNVTKLQQSKSLNVIPIPKVSSKQQLSIPSFNRNGSFKTMVQPKQKVNPLYQQKNQNPQIPPQVNQQQFDPLIQQPQPSKTRNKQHKGSWCLCCRSRQKAHTHTETEFNGEIENTMYTGTPTHINNDPAAIPMTPSEVIRRTSQDGSVTYNIVINHNSGQLKPDNIQQQHTIAV